MKPYATGSVSLGSAEGPNDSDMTHSYRLTEGRLIRYPLIRVESEGYQWVSSSTIDSVTIRDYSRKSVHDSTLLFHQDR